MRLLKYIYILFLFIFYSFPSVFSQTTEVKGRVIDKRTKEPLPFVNVYFENRNIGTITDNNGYYMLKTNEASGQISASFMGYYTQTHKVEIGKSQVINFLLEAENISLNEVIVQSKKKRYRNKGNPAVELMRKVIANKKINRKENFNYYEYTKYEKLEFDINGINDKVKKKKILKKINFIFDYADTSTLDGKVYLPVFLKEKLSKVYYRKEPKAQKEYILGNKTIKFHEFLDSKGVDNLMDHLYEDIDIYKSTVRLATNDFISPLAKIAPATYKYHIVDTVDIDGTDCINVVFYPRDKRSFAFQGNLFITNDSLYAVKKVDMRVVPDINLNWVKDVHIVQEWERKDNRAWLMTKDNVDIIFTIRENGNGILGKKSVFYDKFIVDHPQPDSVYSGIQKIVKLDGYDNRDEEFWKQNRIIALTKKEQSIYSMTDSLKKNPYFRTASNVIMAFVAGYVNAGWVDIGRVNTFLTFNDVEGFRIRAGGRTSDKFSKKVRFRGFGRYGFKDKKFKYSLSGKYSLNKKLPIMEIPEHYLKLTYEDNAKYPGVDQLFTNSENFLLSFKRGVSDKMIYYKLLSFEHYKDWPGGFATTLNLRHNIQMPGGNLTFKYDDNTYAESVTTSEIFVRLRYSPNEKFYRDLDYRVPIISKEPIIQLSYTKGIKGVWDSEYDYQKLQLSFFKRFHLAPIGFTNIEIEGGKVFGEEIPFPLLFVHRANQTYSYQLHAYNLMNFLEFVSDNYISINLEHQFYGFFLNKIPLLRKLKLREVVTFKGLYGGVSDQNNPNVTDGLMLFPEDQYGNQTTFTLEEKPYMEVGVGITNIFKILRIDFIRRLSYLDNPNVTSFGILGKFVLDF
ncbi:MAG: carboxypeptidase-like regulatory domain-containing protein [Chlorobi bacterium]|nr:carboxypeptidase-like regulatory domain-containing protein [Chlorobiota bacterium]